MRTINYLDESGKSRSVTVHDDRTIEENKEYVVVYDEELFGGLLRQGKFPSTRECVLFMVPWNRVLTICGPALEKVAV